MAKYIIQKAVAPEKVVKAKRKSIEELEATYYQQAKLDGCNTVMMLYPDGSTVTMSRTGEQVRSMAHVEFLMHEVFAEDVARNHGLVLLGEAWDFAEFSKISGDFRRHTNSPNLDLMIFDVLLIDEFNDGYSPVPWIKRMERLTADEAGCHTIAHRTPGNYTVSNAMAEAKRLGYRDGIILRDPNGTWTAGSGTTGEIIKVKQVLSFDLKVIGSEPGKGKHEGRMGALIVDFGGKELRVGTGFSDADREANNFNGKIVEVEAMDYSSDGLLREPRFKGIRHDKLEPDTIAA